MAGITLIRKISNGISYLTNCGSTDTVLFCIPDVHATATSFIDFMVAMHPICVIAIDLPGTGQSMAITDYGCKEVARVISLFIAQFNCKKYLMGHGIGGNLSLRLKMSNCCGYILANCAPCMGAYLTEWTLLNAVSANPRRFDTLSGLEPGPMRICVRADNLVENPLQFTRLCETIMKIPCDYTGKKLMMIYAQDDAIVNVEYVKDLCRIIGINPFIVQGGHFSIIDQVSALVAYIRAFLKSQAKPQL